MLSKWGVGQGWGSIAGYPRRCAGLYPFESNALLAYAIKRHKTAHNSDSALYLKVSVRQRHNLNNRKLHYEQHYTERRDRERRFG